MARSNSKSQLISKENSVKKSNELSMAKLNIGLSLNQIQLFAFSIYCTQQNRISEFHKADFEKKFNLQRYKTKDAYQDAEKLMDLKASVTDLENNKFDFWNIFGRISYDNGRFSFTWNEEMLPHILHLKDLYVSTDLTLTSKFNSSFSWVLYEFLKGHYGYWHKPMSKEALLRLFNVEDKKTYIDNTGRFTRSVLDVAVKEINEYTELDVWYKTKKEGRAITGFDLFWSHGTKESSATIKQILELNRIVEYILDEAHIYVNLNHTEDRDRATELIESTKQMREYTNEKEICITLPKADALIRKAKFNFNELNRLLEQDNKPKPPLYNWLLED